MLVMEHFVTPVQGHVAGFEITLLERVFKFKCDEKNKCYMADLGFGAFLFSIKSSMRMVQVKQG